MIKLSRSKLDLFIECPRCFWLDVNKQVKRPAPAPYTINSAIDFLLKQEFDSYRKVALPHPIMKQYKIDAIPFSAKELNSWRHNFTGIQFHHHPTDFLVYGAVDDVWINPQGQLIIVDYKSTGAKEHKIYDSYKRQMEIYQWLFIQNGFKVSTTGYFLFARVNKESGFSEAKLSFELFLEPQTADSLWVEDALVNARKVLDADLPGFNDSCAYCHYVNMSQS